jgi:hypothetical protein
MASVPTKKDSVVKDEKTAPAKDVASVASFGKIEVQIVAVEVPYVDTEADKSDYSTQCNRCDLGRLTKEQARKLRAIRRGYDYSQARLANGGEIKSLADAVRALIDSVDI